MNRLVDPEYMSFPFELKNTGVRTCTRKNHIIEQIEQILFTDPRERVFRPHFGAGLRTLVFEPNVEALRAIVRERLNTALSQALQGEVDLATLRIDFREGAENELALVVAYKLLAVDRFESHQIPMGVING